MNRIQALEETQKLWEQIGRHTELQQFPARKEDFPGPHTEYTNSCPLCEYARCCAMTAFNTNILHLLSDFCEYCPVEWPDDNDCYDDESIFQKWSESQYIMDHAFFAYLLADLCVEALESL